MIKRPLQIIMIIGVCLIWGTIIYRIVIRGKSGEDEAAVITQSSTQRKSEIPSTIRYELAGNYRDPFALNTGKTIVKRSSTSNNVNTKKKKHDPKPAEQPAPPYKWPAIQYRGLMHKTGSEKLLALISIGGKESILHKGDVIDELKIMDISSTELTLQCPTGEIRVFKK